jgi:hypothetical protein
MIKQFVTRIFVVLWHFAVFLFFFSMTERSVSFYELCQGAVMGCAILIALQWICLGVANPFDLMGKKQ